MRFLLPSLIGVLFFLTPMYVDGKITVGMAVFGDWIVAQWKPQLPLAAACFMAISVILTLVFLRRSWYQRVEWLGRHLTPHPFWFSLRVFGLVAAVCFLTGVGPDFLTDDNTSGTMLTGLLPITMTYLGIATFFLPLLTDFGLMEMVGVMMSKVFKRVFQLPGRSAIDALASWMGSGPVGIFITSQQYERGFYSAREAAIISTNFSVVSVSFSLVVINFIGLGEWFVPYYATVLLIGLIAALITPRLRPLSRVPDRLIGDRENTGQQEFASGQTLWSAAMTKALNRAEKAPGPKQLLQQSLRNIMEIWFSLTPVVMGLGTAALVIAEYTPVFTLLAYPFELLLSLLQLPEADKAAATMLVGFADMFLPAVIGASIDSELSRFVIAVVSVSQLIYMSEVGVLIIKSKIPLGFIDILQIFLIRTAIALPIAAMVAHLLF